MASINPKMGRKPKTETNKFIRELRRHIPMLVKMGILKNADEENFRRNFLGKCTYDTWYIAGIRNCYKTILVLLNKIDELYNKNKELQDEVNKFLKGK